MDATPDTLATEIATELRRDHPDHAEISKWAVALIEQVGLNGARQLLEAKGAPITPTYH
jgi:hypothetical protein